MREGAGPAVFDMERQHEFQVNLRLQQATADAIRNAPGFDPYHNPPALALFFVPLTLLPMPWAFVLFSTVSLLSLCMALAIPLRGQRRPSSVAVGLIAFGAVGDTLLGGRVDAVLTLIFSLALLALASGRSALGGALFGLLWLKPQYAPVFALVFLLKRRWRELGAMLAVGLAVAAVSLALVGVQGVTLYVQELRRIGAFHPPAASVINAPMMVNWRALLLNLWPTIPETTGSLATLALGGATVLVSLAAWRGEWDPSSARFARQMLVAACATVVSVPHSHFNATVLLLAPLALALSRPWRSQPQSRWWRPMLSLGYLLGLIVWLFFYLRWLMLPYLLLAIGLLSQQIRADLRTRNGVVV